MTVKYYQIQRNVTEKSTQNLSKSSSKSKKKEKKRKYAHN